MKLKTLVTASLIALGTIPTAQAANEGSGTITFTGSIIEAPCSISHDNSEQTIDLGQISNVALAKSGKSEPRKFTIELENCALSTKKTVTTTFTGPAGGSNRVGIAGTAKGASIAIVDGAYNEIKLGSPSIAQALQDGNNALSFAAYLQGDVDADDKDLPIVPGDFQAVVNFGLNYL
ncbi:type 1 fimbrial protein [Pantoea sp.]|uniref:fimbrial protein n=1 Tax=Pantoea sp. TaxID=69393 RepID=UPI0031E31AAE